MDGPKGRAEGEGPGGGGPADRTLAAIYLEVLGFVQARAARGDPTARRLAAGLHGYATMPPTRAVVRSWLADVASEARLIRPSSDPWTATSLRSLIDAEEARARGSEERVWREVVDGLRAGRTSP